MRREMAGEKNVHFVVAGIFVAENSFSEVCRGADIPGVVMAAIWDRREVSHNSCWCLPLMESGLLVHHRITLLPASPASRAVCTGHLFLLKNEPESNQPPGPLLWPWLCLQVPLWVPPSSTLSVPPHSTHFKVPRITNLFLTQGLHKCCSISSSKSFLV